MESDLCNKGVLVSVVVVSYNSSKHILETLESIKEQTYRNIELIISDDASADTTLEIAQGWVYENECRFAAAKIITTHKNTGIPANCNRGIFAANGEYIKLIAADDLLCEDCIENNLDYASRYSGDILFSFVSVLENNVERIDAHDRGEMVAFFSKDRRQKLKELLRRNSQYFNPPTIFLRSDALRKIGYFDESYRRLEDLPFYINAAMKGYNLDLLQKVTVKRRVHVDSLATSKKSISPFRQEFLGNLYECYRDKQRPYLKFYNLKDLFAMIMSDMTFRQYKEPDTLVKILYKIILFLARLKSLLMKRMNVK